MILVFYNPKDVGNCFYTLMKYILVHEATIILNTVPMGRDNDQALRIRSWERQAWKKGLQSRPLEGSPSAPKMRWVINVQLQRAITGWGHYFSPWVSSNANLGTLVSSPISIKRINKTVKKEGKRKNELHFIKSFF